MIYKILLSILLLLNSQFIYTQNSKNVITDTILIEIDSTLTKFEISFKDSINKLNQQNNSFTASRNAYNSGLDLFNGQQFERAILHFTNSISIDSTFSQAYFYRAKCYEESNDSLSLLDYQLAFNLDSANLLPLYNIARIQANSDYRNAINTYNLITSLNNQESKAYYEIGLLLYLQQKIEKAISFFTQSLLISQNARTLNDRASCYRILDKNELAIKDYLSAIALNSDLAFIYNNLASTYRKQGESTKAISYYTFAIDKDPNYVLAYNNRGSLYIDLNDFDNAFNDISKAISIDSEYAPAYNNKGVIYHNKKDYPKAVSYFDRAITLNINYAKAYLNRGITKQMLRDEDGACNDWLKASELGINVADKYLENDCY